MPTGLKTYRNHITTSDLLPLINHCYALNSSIYKSLTEEVLHATTQLTVMQLEYLC
ncbi:hypothetical protein [Candidatus Chlamydia corallus]|uniref:hypothetical protein n=1 Tax=Candidatus Chlamydia corallus TaxID=2038470 RepID=UPI0018659FEB|nr:hypothetical protein [Candidatus Chlamydia corallus]